MENTAVGNASNHPPPRSPVVLAAGPVSPLRSPSASSEASEAAAVARRQNDALADPDSVGRRSAASDRDEVLLRLLLVSGNRSDFSCPLEWTVSQIKQSVVRNWPTEWQCEERAERIDRLRILYQGRFLDDGVTLKNLNLPKEQFITMHLLLRPSSSDAEIKGAGRSLKKTLNSDNGACCACLQM